MSEPETFGARFAAERIRLGLTQEQVGIKLGRGPQAVSNWENNRAFPRTGADYTRLDALGFDVNYVLTGKAVRRRRLDKVS